MKAEGDVKEAQGKIEGLNAKVAEAEKMIAKNIIESSFWCLKYHNVLKVHSRYEFQFGLLN